MFTTLLIGLLLILAIADLILSPICATEVSTSSTPSSPTSIRRVASLPAEQIDAMAEVRGLDLELGIIDLRLRQAGGSNARLELQGSRLVSRIFPSVSEQIRQQCFDSACR